MRFKSYLLEGIIVPEKISINTLDINKLNKQFKDTIISFEKSDGGAHAAYVPENEEIIVYLDADGEMDTKTLETLVQHEVIHSIQDNKSGMRMADVIQKDYEKLRAMNLEVANLKDDDEISPEFMKKYKELEAKMNFLNPEEQMAYAYMYAKMYKKLSIKEVMKKMTDEWKKWSNQKPSKKMLKYFYSYWTVRKDL